MGPNGLFIGDVADDGNGWCPLAERLGVFSIQVQREGWLVLKVGLIARYTTELLISKVESIWVAQSLLGRLFDFGDVTVTGTGVAREYFQPVKAPIAFRNTRRSWRRFPQALGGSRPPSTE